MTFDLLRCVARVDSMREAANGFGFSYRYACSLLRAAESVLGMALVESRRGHGTHLSRYGALLAAALAEIDAQLAPELDAATQALGATLALRSQRAREAQPARAHRPFCSTGDAALSSAWRLEKTGAARDRSPAGLLSPLRQGPGQTPLAAH